jgi:hypothetical protein
MRFTLPFRDDVDLAAERQERQRPDAPLSSMLAPGRAMRRRPVGRDRAP